MPRDLSSSKEPTPLLLKHLLRKVFLEDWLLKLTALAITFGLWFGVTGLSTPFTKRFTVPLAPSISSNAVITNTVIPDVEIVVSGDKRRVEQLNRADLVASLDLTDVPAGDKVVSLSPETVSVSLPQGIRLVEVQPSRIPVNLELVEEKELAVEDVAQEFGKSGRRDEAVALAVRIASSTARSEHSEPFTGTSTFNMKISFALVAYELSSCLSPFELARPIR